MQLAGFIDDDLRRGPSGRTYLQKIEQALTAQKIERHWTKAQIIEAYLNLVPFRGELTGIGSLSRVMFQKHASGLNAREAALRSEEHTSELQSLMRISYAVFCLQKKTRKK